MNAFYPEQFAAAQKTQLDTFFSLTGALFDGIEKLTALNMQATKAIFSETQAMTQQTLSAKDPRNLLALQGALAQPTIEKAKAYGHHAYEIFAGTQAKFVKVVDANLAEGKRNIQSIVDNAAKNAPARSDAMSTFLAPTIAMASTMYDAFNERTKEAVEAAESHFSAVTAAAEKAAQGLAAQPQHASKIA